MTKKFSRGFTLIELLVVIAIIGILSSVVLASLNTARNKGSDAAIKSNLANARAEAEIYYDTNGTYLGVCALTGTSVIGDSAKAAAEVIGGGTYTVDNTANMSAVAGATVAVCHDLAGGWAIGAPLKSAGAWCVDYTGVSMSVAVTGLDTNNDITCN